MKTMKWSYGIVVSLVVGLSGCYMDGHHSYMDGPRDSRHMDNRHMDARHMDARHSQSMDNSGGSTQAKQKTYATKEEAHKVTPGPKRTAAPKLPVIQQ